MGTSASNKGPKGTPSLLPSWIVDSPELTSSNQNSDKDDESATQNPQTTNWNEAKSSLSRYANGTKGSSLAKAGSKYLKSLGGASAAAKSARQGISTGIRYALFLGDLATHGLENTLTSRGLDTLIGSTPEAICVAIANDIAPIGSTNDEAIARDALISTLDDLYSQVFEEGGDLESLGQLSPEMVKLTMIKYVANYIYSKWLYELGFSVEKGNFSVQEVVSLEREVKNLIQSETHERFSEREVGQIDLTQRDNLALITEIFEIAYSTLEL